MLFPHTLTSLVRPVTHAALSRNTSAFGFVFMQLIMFQSKKWIPAHHLRGHVLRLRQE